MGLSDIGAGLLGAFLVVAVLGDLLLEVDDQRFNVQHNVHYNRERRDGMGMHDHLTVISIWRWGSLSARRMFTSLYWKPQGLTWVFPTLKSYPFHPANG